MNVEVILNGNGSAHKEEELVNGVNGHETEDAEDNGYENGNVELPEPLFSVDSAQNMSFKEPRIFRKAKRFHSNSFSHSGTNGFTGQVVTDGDVDRLAPSLTKGVSISPSKVLYGKNSKKSRSGLRGDPKKGGGGGKGIWGKPGSEYFDFDLDVNDPDYDSDVNDPITLERIDVTMKQDEFDETVTSWLKEYFEHGDPKEIIANLGEINVTNTYRRRLPYLAISLAMQRKPLQCELTSQLLSELCGKVMTGTDMEKGFDYLIAEAADLTLDCPEAADYAGKFIARAVADDVLPPKFVQGYKGQVDSPQAVRALAKAENLLTINHAYVRLDSVWGIRGGSKPTKMLVKKMKLLLDEFLCANDAEEAQRCLRELDSPHFHHELVYQAILMVIEKSTDEVCTRIVRLLDSLCQSVIVTVDQLNQGLTRIYTDMPDIQLDVPAGYLLLERFVSRGQNAGFVSAKLACDIPAKGRKRFVSEGDGGVVKSSQTLLP